MSATLRHQALIASILPPRVYLFRTSFRLAHRNAIQGDFDDQSTNHRHEISRSKSKRRRFNLRETAIRDSRVLPLHGEPDDDRSRMKSYPHGSLFALRRARDSADVQPWPCCRFVRCAHRGVLSVATRPFAAVDVRIERPAGILLEDRVARMYPPWSLWLPQVCCTAAGRNANGQRG